MSKLQTVFIVGATGKTGSSIVDGLLEDSSFHVVAAIRPTSASNPGVNALKDRGVEIRIVDLESASVELLEGHLQGVDTVISAVDGSHTSQNPLIKASKEAGVKRFIPCDWATACVPGVRDNFDAKTAYHDQIKELGLAYTFIDVGGWYQSILPIINPAKELYPGTIELSKTIFGTGNVKTALTDLRDVGKFVARIISDDRTLNKYVFCWAEQYTQKEIIALAERIVGRPIPTKDMSAETVLSVIDNYAPGSMERIYFQLFNSLFVREDNTVENAKKEEYGGALDARELYPDLKPRSLEAFADEFYSE